MAIDTWLAFAVACIVLTLIPGPSVLLVISQAMSKGFRSTLLCILGLSVGGILLMGLSFIGVGAILATSATLFQIVKWAGVAYLAYLGIQQIIQARSLTGELNSEVENRSGWSSFWMGALTALLNPKAIVFYMAFLAQFINPSADLGVQVVLLTATSTGIVAVILIGYALVARQIKQMFSTARAQQKVGYASGSLMLGGSAMLAVTR